MNGQKAKALRKLARYSVTSDRPQLPTNETPRYFTVLGQQRVLSAGGWNSQHMGTCVLPKGHPRRKYHFLKRQYHMVPIAHTLKRMHNSTRLVQAIDRGISAQAEGA